MKEVYFDYWCPKCKNYVLLEWNKDLLEGWCALFGLDISIAYQTWEEQDKK